jgi:hypothetical protein
VRVRGINEEGGEAMSQSRGIFGGTLRLFDRFNIQAVPAVGGVYLIHDQAGPIYVGRSRVDIRARPYRHRNGTGNRIIAAALRTPGVMPLRFEYVEMGSMQQAEAQLIGALGTTRYANLRRETDPADW